MYSVDLMLFDLDGTLIDSRTDLARSVNLMLADLGYSPLGESLIASFVGDGVPTLTKRSLTAAHHEHQPPSDEVHQLAIKTMLAHYEKQMFVDTCLYPQVKETLQYYKNKRKAVVTSKESRFVKPLLEHLGIAEDFDYLIGGDMVKMRKPDPECVLVAMRQLDGIPNKTVMIGDSENDILSGRAAGTITCAVTIGFRTTEQMREYQPDVLIERFDGIKDYFC